MSWARSSVLLKLVNGSSFAKFLTIFLSFDFCVVYPWGPMNGPSCCLWYAHALMDICVTCTQGLVGLVFHSCYPPIVGIHGNVTGVGDVAIHHFCNVVHEIILCKNYNDSDRIGSLSRRDG